MTILLDHGQYSIKWNDTAFDMVRGNAPNILMAVISHQFPPEGPLHPYRPLCQSSIEVFFFYVRFYVALWYKTPPRPAPPIKTQTKKSTNHDGLFLAIDRQTQSDRQRYEGTILSLGELRLIYDWPIFYHHRGWYTVLRRDRCIRRRPNMNSNLVFRVIFDRH